MSRRLLFSPLAWELSVVLMIITLFHHHSNRLRHRSIHHNRQIRNNLCRDSALLSHSTEIDDNIDVIVSASLSILFPKLSRDVFLQIFRLKSLMYKLLKKNKTNHPMSKSSLSSTTASKEGHCLK